MNVKAYATVGLALLVTGFLAFAGSRLTGLIEERNQLRVEVAAQQAQIESLSAVERTTSIVLSDRVQSRAAIQERASNVQVEIEKRLSAPPACVLPPDWRVLHDSAATDTPVPDAASGADAPAVTPQEAARTVTGNYAQCHDTADQLRKLQDWIRGVTDATE